MKKRIELWLDEEILQELRTNAVRKYGKLRSVSQMVENMVVESRGLHTRASDINALKTERQEWIDEDIKSDLTRCEGGGFMCSPGPPFIVCQTCGAEFVVTIMSDGKYCPACRSANIRILRPEEGTIGSRIVAVVSSERKRRKKA